MCEKESTHPPACVAPFPHNLVRGSDPKSKGFALSALDGDAEECDFLSTTFAVVFLEEFGVWGLKEH